MGKRQEKERRSVEAKSSHLGMPFGTACARLRKLLLFDLARKSGMTACFRCGQQITSAADLTIEHKESWLYGPQELFWSLDNIAFSHRGCNVAERYFKGQRGKDAPAGTAWCSGCKEYHKLSAFGANKQGRDNARKVRGYCNVARQQRGWS